MDDKAEKLKMQISVLQMFIIIHLLVGLLFFCSSSPTHQSCSSSSFFFFPAGPSSLYSLFCPPSTSQIRSHLYICQFSCHPWRGERRAARSARPVNSLALCLGTAPLDPRGSFSCLKASRWPFCSTLTSSQVPRCLARPKSWSCPKIQ